MSEIGNWLAKTCHRGEIIQPSERQETILLRIEDKWNNSNEDEKRVFLHVLQFAFDQKNDPTIIKRNKLEPCELFRFSASEERDAARLAMDFRDIELNEIRYFLHKSMHSPEERKRGREEERNK